MAALEDQRVGWEGHAVNDVVRMADSQSEGSHTPGPWECEVTDMEGARVYDVADQAMIAVLDKRASEMAIFVSSEHTKANARLIAAAPDLYATLNDVLDSFDRQTMEEMLRKDNDAHDGDEFCVNLTAKQLRAINQAILKAEGKV